MNKTNFPWDYYSDQPHILKRSLKKELRKGHGFDYFKLIATNLFFFPYLFLKFYFKSKIHKRFIKTPDFYGLCVNLDKGEEQFKLV
jgi:hypothetical protein